MKSYRNLFNYDIILVTATVALLVMGVLFIYSSGVTSDGAVFSNEYVSQIIWGVTGLVLLVIIGFVNYQILKELSPYIFVFFILLLVITRIFGVTVNGARSWLGLVGGRGIQPSEFTKIAAILFLARYLSEKGGKIANIGTFSISFGIVLLPMGLILLQPDLGTALVFLPIFLMMAYMAGAKARHILFILLVGLLTVFFSIIPSLQEYFFAVPVPFLNVFVQFDLLKYVLLSLLVVTGLSVWGYWGLKTKYFLWVLYGIAILGLSLLFAVVLRRVLQEYQIMRLIIFLDPWVDPQGSGWNIIQSMTAIGSGGLVGKGYLLGTQSHYRYLPQQSTDFIFSILAEEWGFFGALLVFALFAVVFFRTFAIMRSSKDPYGMYVSAGILGMMGFHFIVNIGMVMGTMPITGIPLFFLSYGGSSLWTGLISVGLLLSIYMRRYKY